MKFGIVTLSILFVSAAGLSGADVSPSPNSVRGPAGDPEHINYTNVNGVRLAYRLEGAGVPVIFLHGEGYSHELWTEQVQAFRRDYLFVSYDRRGHGLSDDPETGYSVIAHAEDLKSLMEHFGMQDAHLVVNSRGGAIAIQFLRMYPEQIRSITFADATIPLVPISEESAFKSAISRLQGPPPTLQEALEKRELAKTSPFTKVAQSRSDTRKVLDRMIDQYSPRVAMNAQRSDMASPMDLGPWNSREFPDMSKIWQPTLLLVGEFTDVFFIDGAKVANRLWPNSRYHMFPATDHLLMLEAPDAFNRVVLEFLTEVDDQIAERNRLTTVLP